MEILSKIALAFSHGGFWMWPILALQVVSIAIVIERFYSLYSKRKLNQVATAAGFEESIRRGEIDTVINKAKTLAPQSAVARAVLAGATAAKYLGGKDEIQGKMDEVLIHENSLIDRRTGFLTMLGNVATLMGLLGTISGMISSFASVAYASPAEKAALLAAGISEAMNCTAYGLITAIPALLCYAVLQNRANLINEDLNQGALKAFNWLSYSYEPVGFKSFKKGEHEANA
jgi:biopolymer transport protein ExbB/TolQ